MKERKKKMFIKKTGQKDRKERKKERKTGKKERKKERERKETCLQGEKFEVCQILCLKNPPLLILPKHMEGLKGHNRLSKKKCQIKLFSY